MAMDAIVPPEEGRQPVAASLRANQCGGVEEGEGKRRGGGGGRTHSRGDLRDRRRRRRRKKEDLASWALEVAAEKGGGEVTTSWGEERKGKLFPQVEEADEEEERKKRRRRTRKLLISTTSSFSSITPSAATAAAAAPGGGARDASAVVVGTRPPASSSSWCHPLVSSFRRSLPRASPMHVAILMVVMALGTANAVAECMSGNRVMCFNCNSFQDDRCGDTFNWTNQPAKKPCAGCCVKMVQGIGTEDEKIRRSCTDDIDINLFMVDHVCMTEGGGKGKMCFCEENECNGARRATTTTTKAATAATAMVATLASLILLR